MLWRSQSEIAAIVSLFRQASWVALGAVLLAYAARVALGLARRTPDPAVQGRLAGFKPRLWEVCVSLTAILLILIYQDARIATSRVVAILMTAGWSASLGIRSYLGQITLPRPPNPLVDLPGQSGQSFRPHSWEGPLMIGALIGNYLNGTLTPWDVVGLLVFGFFIAPFPVAYALDKWLMSMQPGRVMIWSMRARNSGQMSESLAILERFVRIEPKDYLEQGRLADRFRGRLGWALDAEIRYGLALAESLLAVGAHRELAFLIEQLFGIRGIEVVDPIPLASMFRAYESQVPREVLARYVIGLMWSLTAIREFGRGKVVLEGFLGLHEAPDQSGTETGHWLRVRLLGLDEEVGLELLATLAIVRSWEGRNRDTVALMESYLELPGGDYTETARAIPACARFDELPEGWPIKLGTLFVQFLVDSGRRSEGAALLARIDERGGKDGAAERNTHKTPADDGDATQAQMRAASWLASGDPEKAVAVFRDSLGIGPRELASSARLRERFKRISPAVAVSCLIGMRSALALLGRQQEAVRLIESYLRIDRAAYRTPKRLSTALEGPLRHLAAEAGGGLIGSFADALRQAGRVAEAVGVCRVYLNREDFREGHGDLADCLRPRLEGMSPNAASLLLDTVVGVQEAAGLRDEAKNLLGTWFRLFIGSGDTSDRSAIDPPILAKLFDGWLNYHGDDPRAVPACRAVVPKLRSGLAEMGVTLEDRRRFIETTSGLRRRIVDVGHRAALRTTSRERATALRLEVQCWDMDLGQRILIERFLSGQTTPIDVSAVSVAEGWSFWDEDRDPSPGHLPTDVASRDLANFGLSASPAGDGVSAAGPPLPRDVPPPWLELARSIVAAGVDEPSLAGRLAPGTILLRASFLPDGRLTWTALRRGGAETVEVIASDGGGDTTDRHRLRWAGAFHDFQLALAWRHQKRPAKFQEWIGEAVDRFEEISRRTDLEGQMEATLDALDVFDEQARRLGFLDVSDRLRDCVMLQLEDWKVLGDWHEFAASRYGDLLGFIMILRDLKPGELPFPDFLDHLTRTFLEEVEGVWNLDSLAPFLDEETTDLVLQLDDVLHAVSVPHLRAGGRPLYCRVRSIRETLSFLLSDLQERTERQARASGDGTGRMLTVSWFEEGTAQLDGSRLLHHGQGALAGRYGLKWYSASQNPEGSSATVARAIEEHGDFRVVTICGDGHPEAGVRLRDPLPWKGQGCALDLVEFLILVSCSVGRVKETGLRDVEGFVVELATHRARSVLGCRWPVDSQEAPCFANEVVARYLESRQDLPVASSVVDSCLRARALNSARKRFFDDANHPTSPYVGLNTVCAFELFGLP